MVSLGEIRVGGGGGKGGGSSESPAPRTPFTRHPPPPPPPPARRSESPAPRTAFSRLPYVCAPLPPDPHPSLCCSRRQVNQEDKKPKFNFQTVPILNILVRFVAFVLARGSSGPDESYYKSVFLVKLSFTNLVITV